MKGYIIQKMHVNLFLKLLCAVLLYGCADSAKNTTQLVTHMHHSDKSMHLTLINTSDHDVCLRGDFYSDMILDTSESQPLLSALSLNTDPAIMKISKNDSYTKVLVYGSIFHKTEKANFSYTLKVPVFSCDVFVPEKFTTIENLKTDRDYFLETYTLRGVSHMIKSDLKENAQRP